MKKRICEKTSFFGSYLTHHTGVKIITLFFIIQNEFGLFIIKPYLSRLLFLRQIYLHVINKLYTAGRAASHMDLKLL